ncbi:alpha/beta fold hydrolase [Erythrobacter sp. AP23]|uniref:alpha/beta fold hydrolase n=1 Tax=Erythrobacter sp. AP23 TaxID=499656 RepID=UPI00076C2C12|nr:alpha/beta hydrolase [Erythrobacter sp. AP23]KWV94023.1 alpha/beta hydrolase [Erythrobacter sp. AP23]
MGTELAWNVDQTVETPAGVVAFGACGEGEDLILAHGWPWSSFCWHRIVEPLARRFRVHWYDMPGYGQSEMSGTRPTSLDVQGEVFAYMLDTLKLDRPHVLAHDFGGAVSLRAHLLHGCEYRRYVLMNVVALRPWGSEFFDHVGRHVEAFEGLPPPIHKAVVAAYIQGALSGDVPQGDFERLCAPWLTDEGRKSFYNQFAQADERYTAEFEDRLSEVKSPVKVLWGERDPWIPLDRGRRLASLLDAELAVIEGAGHLPQLEAPHKVVRQVLAFLDDEPDADEGRANGR